MMRFVTETRFKQLEEIIQSIPDQYERSYALHLIKSIQSDIDDNYAEIQRPIRLERSSRRPDNS